MGKSFINNAFANNSANFGAYQAGNGTTQPSDVGPLYSRVVDILPFLDQQSLYNSFNRNRFYFGTGRSGDDPSKPTDLVASSTWIAVLTCPDD